MEEQRKVNKKYFRIDSGVRQGCVISLWLSKVYMDEGVMKVKIGMEKIRDFERRGRKKG